MKPSSLPARSYSTHRVHAEAADICRWLGYKLVGIAAASGASFVVPGAVAGLGFGTICARAVTSEGPKLGEWFQTSTEVCQAIFRFGLACALTGVGALVVWALSRGWPPPLVESPADDPAHEPSAIVLALGVALGAIPLMLLMSAWPAIAFVLDNIHLLSQQMDGIVLMVPILQLTIASTWLGASIGLFLLFVAKDRLFPRTFLVSLAALAGLLAASYQVLVATRLITVPIAEEIPMSIAHARAIASVVRGLGWAFAASAVMAPFVLMSRAVRARCADRSLELPADAPPAPVALRREPPIAGSTGTLGNRFYIQATYVGGFFGARLSIRDLDAGRTLVARAEPLRFRSRIQVDSLLRIEARRALSVGGPYDVLDATSSELLAVVRKRLAGDWEIHDAQDALIGVVTRGEWGMGHANDRILIGSNEVGTFHWSNMIKPALELDCSIDVEQLLDRRIGLALGILLFLNRSLPSA